MAQKFTSYIVDNDKSFQRAIDRATKTVDDLRVPFALILTDFQQSEKAIFKLKGPGQYPDLQPSTKNTKFRDFGFRYPILKRTGRLEKSLTRPTHPDSIAVVGKKVLAIGTKVPYGIYHQSDSPRKSAPNRPGDLLPQRKFLFIGPEAMQFQVGKIKGRLQRWNSIMNSFVLQSMAQQGFKIDGVFVDPKTIPVKG